MIGWVSKWIDTARACRERLLAGAIVVVLVAGCQAPYLAVPDEMIVTGVPAIPRRIADDVDAFQGVRYAELIDWFEGGVLLTTRWRRSVELQEVRVPGSIRHRVTFTSDPIASAWVNPNDARPGFLYSRDLGGSEFFELVWFDRSVDRSFVVSESRGRILSMRWASAGDRFAYSRTASNDLDWNVVVRDLDGMRRTLVEGEGVGWYVEDFSADGSRLLVSQYVSVTASKLYEIDVASGERRSIAGTDQATTIGHARYGPNDEILFTADFNADHVGLFAHDRQRRAHRPRIAVDRYSIEQIEVSPARGFLAIVRNVDGYSQLAIEKLDDGGRLEPAALPRGVISTLRFDGEERLAMTITTPTQPADVYSVDLASGAVTRWTTSTAAASVAPTLVEITSFDGLRVPAFVYQPETPGPHPVLVSLHGGPESQARPRFSPSIQYFVQALGIAVVVPNVRGSSGYGRRYLDLDNGKQREDALRDVGALLDWLRRDPDFDEDRVAVSGGSYGGYLVLAALAVYGDRLVAGIDRMGISRFVTFLENTEPYRRDLRRVEYGDERDPEMRAYLEAISPRNRVAAIRDAVLIAQGANDPRVPRSESEQMVRALGEQNVPVWYILALNEGHGFRKRANRDYLLSATAAFLDRFLLARSQLRDGSWPTM